MFQIHYPCKPHIVYQKFGDSDACTPLTSTPGNRSPIVSKVNGVCPAGFTELYPLLGMKGHTGTDLYAPDGWIIRSPFDGIIKEKQTESERGLGIGVITHDRREIEDYGTHFVKARQWHLKSIFVSLGQTVKVGDILGLADNTGLSSGSHNHFEIKPVEYNSDGTHYNVYQNNGYFGAIDPEPFWSGLYAEDYADLRTKIFELSLTLQTWLQKR